MMKLEGIATFVAIAEAGSLSEAARRLGVAKSVVSDRLSELERTLGGRLVQRTTRKMTLTADGAGFLQRGRRIVAEAAEAAAEMAERRGELVGPLRVSGPVSFGVLHLGPALYPFLAANPGIDLSLELDDRFVDVAADGYDAVIRHGPIRDNRLVARRLAASRRLLVASPGYLEARGTPRTLADLETQNAILYTNRSSDWRFGERGSSTVIHPTRALRLNNGLVMRDAALAGLGLAVLPTFMIHAELIAGTLVAVEVGAEAEAADIYIAYAAERGASAKMQALTRGLRQAFGRPPYWEAGLAPRGS